MVWSIGGVRQAGLAPGRWTAFYQRGSAFPLFRRHALWILSLWSAPLESSFVHPSDYWLRVSVGAFLGIALGTLSRAVVTAIIHDPFWGSMSGFAIGGLVAGALQGSVLRPYPLPKGYWLVASCTGWMVLACIKLSLPPNAIWMWACDDSFHRWAFISAANGGIVGLCQGVVLWRFRTIRYWYMLVQIGMWMSWVVLPMLLFGSILRGEGGCHYYSY